MNSILSRIDSKANQTSLSSYFTLKQVPNTYAQHGVTPAAYSDILLFFQYPLIDPKLFKLWGSAIGFQTPPRPEVLPTGLYGVDLENFESWLRPEDPAVLQTSSVLDTKLYYPEPFVHEEI